MGKETPQRTVIRRARGGFTLLEMLVAITALAVAGAFAVPTYQRVTGETADRVTGEALSGIVHEATRTSFATHGRVNVTRDQLAFAVASVSSSTTYTLVGAGAPSAEPTQISAAINGASINLAARSESGRCVHLAAIGVANPEIDVTGGDGPCIADEPEGDAPGGGSGGLVSPLVAQLVAPADLATGATLSTGGWSAVVHGDRVYGVARRTGPGDPELTCAMRRTTSEGGAGTECTGYPANFTAPGSGDFSTSYAPDAVVIDGNLWTSATREAGALDEVGVYCWSLEAALPCEHAWFPLARNVQIANHGITAGAAVAPVTGVQRVGSRLYLGTALPGGARKNFWEAGPFVPAVAAQIHCFDTATKASCGTTNVAGSTATLPGWNLNENRGRAPTMVSTLTSGGRMYFIIDHGQSVSEVMYWNGSAFVGSSQHGNRIVCFDTNTNALCAGWTVPMVHATALSSGGMNASSLLFENPNLANSLCVVTNHSTNTNQFFRNTSCHDTTTGAPITAGAATHPGPFANFVVSSPPTLYASNQPAALKNPVMFDGAVVGTRRYSVFQVDQQRVDQDGARLAPGVGAYTSVSCFDLATNAPCAGFGTNGVAAVRGVTGGHGLDGNIAAFSLSADDNGCLWVLGDYGNVTNMDPDTGAMGCGRSASVAQIDASEIAQACMIGTPTLTYSHAQLTGTTENPISSATLTVSTPTGPTAGHERIPFVDGSVDLTGLPSGVYSFTVNTVAGGPWAGTPAVEIHFNLRCNT